VDWRYLTLKGGMIGNLVKSDDKLGRRWDEWERINDVGSTPPLWKFLMI
jgi:hypothetical protein